MWESLLIQFVVPALTAFAGGVVMHLWHSRGTPSTQTPSSPATPGTPSVPLPIPSDVFPKHPLLSHIIGKYGDELESALLGQLKSKLGLGELLAPPK